jgi:hypothetical protein
MHQDENYGSRFFFTDCNKKGCPKQNSLFERSDDGLLNNHLMRKGFAIDFHGIEIDTGI